MSTEIPTIKGRRYGKEKVNIKDSLSFDLPERDPGRIPSLQRQLVPPKPVDNTTGTSTRSPRQANETGRGNPSNRSVPTRPSLQSNNKEEKAPNLSELL